MRLNGEYFMIVGEKQDDLLYFDAWGQPLVGSKLSSSKIVRVNMVSLL
jgi:hypothetical protein